MNGLEVGDFWNLAAFWVILMWNAKESRSFFSNIRIIYKDRFVWVSFMQHDLVSNYNKETLCVKQRIFWYSKIWLRLVMRTMKNENVRTNDILNCILGNSQNSEKCEYVEELKWFVTLRKAYISMWETEMNISLAHFLFLWKFGACSRFECSLALRF